MDETLTDRINPKEPLRHEIDSDPEHTTEKGAALGGVGGAMIGGLAGSVVGPAGTAIGAAIGGFFGAVASGAAVNAVDGIEDNDTETGADDHAPGTASLPPDYEMDGLPNSLDLRNKAADTGTTPVSIPVTPRD